WSKLRDASQQGIDPRPHIHFVRPLPVERLLQNVHRLQAQIHHRRRGFQFSLAQAPDQILDAVSNRSQSLQPDLRRRTLDGVNGAKQFVDLFRIVVAFQRNQAVTDDLKVLFRLRLEEFKNFVRNFVVRRQRVKIRSRRRRDNRLLKFLSGERLLGFRLRKVQRRRLRGKRKAIALLENGD